jgi:hypothetical protein
MNIVTQSQAWQRGYAWAGDGGDLGCHETCELYGYDFDTPEYEDFMRGADLRQYEQIGDTMGYDWLDSDDGH